MYIDKGGQVGRWEGDTIIGANHKQVMVIRGERKTSYPASHRSLYDVARDFVKMVLHGLGIGVRQCERCAFCASLADGAEEIDVLVAPVGGLPGP